MRILSITVVVLMMVVAALSAEERRGITLGVHMLGGETGTRPVVGVGTGIVFHYGPDYNSSADDRGESFFSIGPIVHGFAGLTIGDSNFTSGIRGFFSPLFTSDGPAGIVAGGGVELHYGF